MVTLLVLADDFTGALDTGVQFSHLGIKTLVTTDQNLRDKVEVPEVSVLVIDTETRHHSSGKAYQVTYDLVRKAKSLGIPFIYKKVDSALRGNISSELKALVDTGFSKSVSFVPAFPKMNRIVKDGVLYIDGEPVSKSVFANDPYEPVLESDIVLRMDKEAKLKAYLIKQGDEIPEDPSLYLFDSETDSDLEAIGQKLQERQWLKVTAGCAGFARILSRLIFPKSKSITLPKLKPLLVISGSVNDISKRQVDYAQKLGAYRASLTVHQILTKAYWESEEGQKFLDEVLNQADSSLVIFETHSDSTSRAIKDLLKHKKITQTDLRFGIADNLGELMKSLLDRGVNRTLFLTGGDTLFRSLKVLGITDVIPLIEYDSGVVLSQINWQGKIHHILTKSGGFGKDNLFINLYQRGN